VSSAGDPTTGAVLLAAERLRRASANGRPCLPVRDLIGAGDVHAAYAVQQELLDAATRAGDRRIGRKIGLTSIAVQQQLGVDQPDFGSLLDSMVVPDGGSVAAGRLLQPRIEAEIAVTLEADLSSRGVSFDEVRAAVREIRAALEIVDSRVVGWDISIADTVADNASSGLFVLSRTSTPLADLDLTRVRMQLTCDGAVASSGLGAACLGDPLLALQWLARRAADGGDPLRAGEVVLTGALGPMVPVTPGAAYEARIDDVGDVSVRFLTADDTEGERP